jgi:hypothetical protein
LGTAASIKTKNFLIRAGLRRFFIPFGVRLSTGSGFPDANKQETSAGLPIVAFV